MNSTFQKLNLVFKISIIFWTLGNASTLYAKSLGFMISPGELAEAHKDIEGMLKCIKCHAPLGGIPDEKCLICHKKLAKKLNKKLGYHATFSEKCFKCHSDHKGRRFNMVKMDIKHFPHKKTGYLLTNKHKKVECIKCHTKKNTYLDAPIRCDGCHKDIHRGKLEKECEQCHSTKDWIKLTFKHGKASDLNLKNRPAPVKCIDCHKKEDKHKNSLGPKCEKCHSVKTWKTKKYNHNKARYKLTGRHNRVRCSQCHPRVPKKRTQRSYKRCSSRGCHTTARDKRVHGKQFKGQGCSKCHTTIGWKMSTFKHEAPSYKGYKLKGKHEKIECTKCHKKGKYINIPVKRCDTKDCHSTSKDKRVHGKQFKIKDCGKCHTESNWKQSTFKHNSSSYKGYRLKGKHKKVKCVKCHKKGKYTKIKYKRCNTSYCHNTKKDKKAHRRQFKGRGCKICHNLSGWKPSTFRHENSSYKGYKLYGKHKNIKCATCHRKGRYVPISSKRCSSRGCHDKSKDKKVHGRKYRGKDCGGCHTVQDWAVTQSGHKNSSFKSFFNAEKKPCSLCHKDPHFNQFGSECSDCHKVSMWVPAKFIHSKIGVRLKGSQRNIECSGCHKNRVYRIAGSSGIDPPPHDHIFPQTHGGTIKEDCNSCHPNEIYSNKGGCIDCHRSVGKTIHKSNINNGCWGCHSDGKR